MYIILLNGISTLKTYFDFTESDRIVGGAIENPAHSNPWQALVLWGGELCGGTILNSRFVLTASHCIPKNLTISSTIIAGANTWYICYVQATFEMAR